MIQSGVFMTRDQGRRYPSMQMQAGGRPRVPVAPNLNGRVLTVVHRIYLRVWRVGILKFPFSPRTEWNSSRNFPRTAYSEEGPVSIPGCSLVLELVE